MSFRDASALFDQFAELRARRTGALIVSPSPPIDETRARIAELALKHRLPTMFPLREYVEAGGLMSYGSNLGVQHRAPRTMSIGCCDAPRLQNYRSSNPPSSSW